MAEEAVVASLVSAWYSSSEMQMRINPTLPPPFHELDEYAFQRLTADIIAKEQHVATSEVYGKRGQKQYGIDVRAPLKNGGLDVAQCKCYQEFTPTDLTTASDEFLNHLQHWTAHNVKTFIVIVACDVIDAKIQEQENTERSRFHSHNIKFELWGASTIERKLRPHRDIVRKYLPPWWESHLCGNPDQSIGITDSHLKAGADLVLQISGILPELGALKNTELESIRSLVAEGKSNEALRRVQTFRLQDSWSILPGSTKAKALRIECALQLGVNGDLKTAMERLTEARRVAPEDNYRPLEALIERHQRGPRAALKKLSQPETNEEWNLCFRFLLETGDAQAALHEIEQCPNDVRANDQTVWPYATALLLVGEVPRAHSLVTTALNRLPNSFELRELSALILYRRALSDAFPAVGHLTWPVPPSWDFVKRDLQSRNGLANAAKIFSELAEKCDPDEVERLLVWSFACSANDANHQDVAAEKLHQILAGNPACSPAILWGTERGFQFDQQASVLALEQTISNGASSVDDVLILFDLFTRTANLDRARQLLDDRKAVFETNGAVDLWLLHRAQISAALDNVNEGLSLAEKASQARRGEITTAVLRVVARRTGDFAAFARALEERFIETNETTLLFECCVIKARIEDFGFIAKNAENLVQRMQTEQALRLAVDGCFHAKEWSLCASLLDANKNLLPNEVLPTDLKRVLSECYRQTDRLSEALLIAEELAREKPTFDTVANLFSLQRDKGDLPACVLTARRLTNLSDSRAHFLLHAATLLKAHDPQLAAELWLSAQQRVGSDANAAIAVAMSSFQLGTEERARDLISDLPNLAGKAGVPLRALSLSEAREWIRNEHEEASAIIKKYYKGELPIHLVTSRINWSMAQAFHEQFLTNQKSQSSLVPPIFVRNGCRSIDFQIEGEAPLNSIFIDVSSLILAETLGILDLVEQSFQTIYISYHTTSSLLNQLTKLAPHQPSEDAAREDVLTLVSQKAIVTYAPTSIGESTPLTEPMGAEWVALVAEAVKEKAVVVDFWPLCSNDDRMTAVDLQDDAQNAVCGAGDVISAMSFAGVLADKDAHAALESLGQHAVCRCMRLDLPTTSRFYLDHGTATQLAKAGVLAKFTEVARVLISRGELEGLQSEHVAAVKRQTTIAWTKTLLARISKGMDSHKYQTHKHPRPDETISGRLRQPDEQCLADTLNFGEQLKFPVWCDDRFLTGHKTIGTAHLVDTFQVLQFLRKSSKLSDDDYFMRLSQLRSANVRYLPVSSEEILYFLRKARITAGSVQGTPQLKILRRYMAGCMLDRDRIQPGVVADGQWYAQELTFLLELNRAVPEALAQVWIHAGSAEEAIARAEWIRENLLWDMIGFREATPDGKTETATSQAAQSVMFLFAQAVRVQGELRKPFIEWINLEILRAVSQYNETLLSEVTKSAEEMLRDWCELVGKCEAKHGKGSVHVLAYKRVLGEFICQLPASIEATLTLDEQTQNRLGVSSGNQTVGFMDERFPARAFWNAAARALDNGNATVMAKDTTARLRFVRDTSGGLALRAKLTRKQGIGDTGRLAPHFLAALSDNAKIRRRCLENHSEWFDRPDDQRREAIEKLTAIKDSAAFVQALRNEQRNASSWIYSDLIKRLNRRDVINIDDLQMLSPRSYVDHLRLVDSAGKSLPWSKSVEILLAEERLEETIVRLSCLPCSMPGVVIAALESCSVAQRLAIIDTLQNRLISPTQRIHFVAIAVQFASDSPALLTTAAQFVEHMVSDAGRTETETFLSVLRWVNLQMGWKETFNHYDTATRLRAVWTHANRLHQAFCLGDAEQEALGTWFRNISRDLSHDLILPDPSFVSDVSHPSHVSYVTLVIRGFVGCLRNVMPSTLQGLGFPKNLSLLLEDIKDFPEDIRSLAQDVSLRGNLLASYLAENDSSLLERFIGSETWKQAFVVGHREDVEATVLSLQQEPYDELSWVRMNLALGGSAIYSEMQPRLVEVLAKLQLPNHFFENPQQARNVIMYVCRQAQHVADDSLRENLSIQLVNLAFQANRVRQERGGKLDEDQSFARFGGAIVDSLWHLGTPGSDSVAMFCSRVEKVFNVWPELAASCREPLSRLLLALPIGIRRGAWRLIFVLRSLN